MQIEVSMSDEIGTEEVIELYKANGWSSAAKPLELLAALRNSHTLVTARVSELPSPLVPGPDEAPLDLSPPWRGGHLPARSSGALGLRR